MVQPDLLKIPILLLVAYAGHTTLTSPTTTPGDDEQKKYGTKRDTVTKMIWILPAVKTALWFATLSEVVAIIARQAPSTVLHAVSQSLCHSPSSAARIGFTPTFLIGVFLVFSGAALRHWCFSTLGPYFTFHLAVRPGHALITSGPYAHVRHPAYAGFLAYGAGSVLCLFGHGAWVRECELLPTVPGAAFAFVWTGLVIAISAMFMGRGMLEDETLRREFGKKWVEYARRTPYRMIPYIY